MKYDNIILDLDGTVYPKNNPIVNHIRDTTLKWIQNKMNLSSDEVHQIYSGLPAKHPHPYFGFWSLGLHPQEYMAEVFDKINAKEFLCENERAIRSLNNQEAAIHIATLASKKHAEKVLEALGIRSFIDEIYCAIDFAPNYSKGEIYDLIPDNKIVIGDSEHNDIEPAKKRGIDSILLREETAFEVIERL